MITLKQISYALAVGRNLHFKKAAEECSISQSALSTALSEMEKQLGFQIFERDNKKVLVTPLGRQVLDKAQQIQAQMQDLEKLGDLQKQPLSTPMSIGIIPTIGPYLLPVILPAIRKQYPNLELTISEATSGDLVEQVRRGEIDTAILALPYACDGLLSFAFWEENFYWITQAGDSSAGKAAIAAQELDPDSLMLLQEGHCLKDHALAACKLPVASPHSLSATSLSTLVQLVAGGMGSTLVPEMALPQLVDNNPALARVPLKEPGPHRRIAFIVRPNYPMLGNVEALQKLIGEQLQKGIARSDPG